MSIRTTDSDPKVALYDSVTGFAFGPVFEDSDDANAFLAWYRDDSPFSKDLRTLSDADWTLVLKAYTELKP
jgi:hypothetical protein